MFRNTNKGWIVRVNGVWVGYFRSSGSAQRYAYQIGARL